MDILWEFLENLFVGWRITGSYDDRSQQWTSGRRRSIVRIIGTLLPFPKAQRVHLNLAVWQNDNEYQDFSVDSPHQSNAESIDEGLESASTLYRNNLQSQENSDMRKLLEEIIELKSKMNEIIERQKASSCCDSVHHSSGANTVERTVNSTTPKSAPPLPPPPPPPPPLPPFRKTRMPDAPVVPRVYTPTCKQLKRNPSPNRGVFDNLMMELKQNKTRLKPLPRTPGGHPLKNRSSDTDTPGSEKGDTLTDILRRRYLKSQPDSDQP